MKGIEYVLYMHGLRERKRIVIYETLKNMIFSLFIIAIVTIFYFVFRSFLCWVCVALFCVLLCYFIPLLHLLFFVCWGFLHVCLYCAGLCHSSRWYNIIWFTGRFHLCFFFFFCHCSPYFPLIQTNSTSSHIVCSNKWQEKRDLKIHATRIIMQSGY